MKGYKTLIFNAAVAAFGTLDATVLGGVIPTEYLPTVIAVIGAVNMILRALTNTPLGKAG